MTDAKTIAVDTGRLPRSVVWGIVAICIAPWLLSAVGVDFGVGAYGGPPLGDLEGVALTDAMHQRLAGSFVHALLEWTAFALALFTVVLAFAHYGVYRDVATPVIGLALFLAGSVDAFHTLAATGLIPAVAENARFIPFTWAISRTFHAVIAIAGVAIFLLGRKRAFQYSPRFLLITGVALVLFAYLTIRLTAASPLLPVTEFPNSIIKRPYDVPALVLFLVAGVFIYPRFLAQRRSVFAHALLIAVIPEVTTQLHMVFQSKALFDSSFNVAHFLKIVAYAVPLTGLALDYVRSHRERQRLALQHSTERLGQAQSTERQLQELFDDAPLMYVVVSMAEGPPVVTDCNKRFLSILGYQREEVLGKPLDHFYDLSSKSSLANRFQAGFPDEGTFQAEERGLVCRDGRILRTMVWLSPRLDANGRATGGHLVYTDLSQLVLAEEALAESRQLAIAELTRERALLARRVAERTADLSASNAELARASRAKDDFLASMSHELRTPLNAILGSSEALQEGVYGPVNARQRGSLELVEESGRHLLALINDILDLSKMEAGKLELDLDVVDVSEVCEISVRFVKEAAHKKRIQLTTSIDRQVSAVNADGRLLKQILVNLLTNAVKFTPEGGEVGLDVVGDADREVVRLSVWDTGIGISRDQMTHLFQPFTQVDTGLDRKYEGTGLGLSLVARMVELHGGSVMVDSAGEGEGSRFTVALSWDPSAVAKADQEEVDATPAPIRRALVVEDSPSAAELMERYLKEMDVSCTVLDRGESVLEVATASVPDIILLDLLLPGESGWDVLAQLRADPRTRDIPVVVVSVVDERVRGLESGAQEYLVKPFTRDQLRAALEVSVEGRNVPIPTSEPVRLSEPQSDAEPGLEAAPLILIAEDNEANIRSISAYLLAKGFRLAVARNGKEAVDQTRELRPDMILMDIQMPGMNGLEAMRQIRKDPDLSSVPIIALTALAMPGDRERTLEAGANEYMAKPVTLRKLVVTMRTLLPRSPVERRS